MQSSLDVFLDAADSNIVIIRNETRMPLKEFMGVAGEVYRFASRVYTPPKLITNEGEA